MRKNILFKKRFALSFVVLCVLTLSNSSSVSSFPSKNLNPVDHVLSHAMNEIIYVDDNNTLGPWDGSLEHPFQRIQDGINHSKDSDTVYVFSGMYYEHVWVNRTISLIGEDRETTIIDANHSSVCVFLASGNVHVTGFTMQNSGTAEYNDAGVGIKNFGHDSNGNIIEGNIMLVQLLWRLRLGLRQQHDFEQHY